MAAGLMVGGLAVTAGAAHAVTTNKPNSPEGFGYLSGYELDWDAPTVTTGLVGYSANIYLASDTTFSHPVQTAQAVDLNGPDDDDDLYADFDGLTPGVKYVGTVVADYGVGGLSDPAVGDADYARKPLTAVRSLTVKPGKQSLTVRWAAPPVSGATGTVALYLVSTPDAHVGTAVSGGARSAKLSGLTNGKKYAVTVTPVSDSFDFGATATKSATPIGSPKKPTKLTRTWKSGGKAKLTWKGAKSTAAAPVTGYNVYVNGKKVATLSKSARSYTAKHEKKGKKYSFSVRARNAVGTSSAASIGKKKRP